MKAKMKKRGEDTTSPYHAARRTWNDQVALPVSAAQTWQVVGILSLLIALAAVGGMAWIGSQSKFIPFVVQVDQLGQAQAAAPLDPTSPVDPRIKTAMIARFITDIRTVTPDVQLQRRSIFRVYAMITSGDPSFQKAQEWYTKETPFEKASRETVDVDIKSALPQSATTWQVDWVETVRDRKGKKLRPPYRMRALVQIYIRRPSSSTSEADLWKNPMGIFVKNYSWSKQI